MFEDLRFAARRFAHTPIVSATMIGIFALGIGFSTALLLFIPSFLNGAVPGISRQESLVRIRGIDRTRPGRAIGREFSYPELSRVRGAADALQRRRRVDVVRHRLRIISAVQGSEPPTGIVGLSGLVAVFVIGVALLASWIPARAAARIDPLAALRVE